MNPRRDRRPSAESPDPSARKARAPRTSARASRTDGEDDLDAVFASVARYFSLLAETTRLKILHVICSSERSVSDIVQATGVGQTNVSRHLSLLHQAGVVARRKDGNTVYYKVADPEFVQICRTVCVQIAGRIDAGQPLREELLHFALRR